MLSRLSTLRYWMVPLFRFLLVIATLAIVLRSTTLLAQDDTAPNAAPTPAPSQDADQPTGAVAPDNGTGAQDDGASFQTFYDGLASQGTWIQSNDYGYVWQPQVNDPDWAPYTAGHWVYSDAGWTWVSDESWGWATYHYGRWANIAGTGWVWIPGYTWAPAWVSWRYGDGYAGWAPLPPDSFVGVDYSTDDSSFEAGYHIGGDVDEYYGIGPALYIFLPVNCLCYHNYHGYYCHHHDNFSIINNTENVTNINVSRNKTYGGFSRVSTGGPKLAQVNDASQTPIPTVTLARTNQLGGGGMTGNSLAVYAPHIGTGTAGKPARVGANLGEAKINRGTDITQPLLVNSTVKPPAPTQAEIDKARTAQGQIPAGAKILGSDSPFKPTLQTPVTSLKPMVVQNRNVAPGRNVELHQQPVKQTPIFASPARTYPQTENQVYPGGPSTYQPQPHTTPSGTPYNPYVPRQSAPVTVAPSAGGAGGMSPRVNERPSAPASTAPVVHESAPSGGSSGGGRVQASGSGPGDAQSSPGSGSPYGQSSGGTGAGSGGGSAGGPPPRNH